MKMVKGNAFFLLKKRAKRGGALFKKLALDTIPLSETIIFGNNYYFF
jgi:hypothetical protein